VCSGYLRTYSDPVAETLETSCRDADLGKGGLQPDPRLHGAGGEQRRSLQAENRVNQAGPDSDQNLKLID
jgi:hypothetical protein